MNNPMKLTNAAQANMFALVFTKSTANTVKTSANDKNDNRNFTAISLECFEAPTAYPGGF